MNKVKVRGGKRKELAVEEISRRTKVPISEMIALGDSITDINMLQRLKDEGGIAVSFNGNRFTAERATVAVTTPNNLGTLPVFHAKDRIDDFLDDYERLYQQSKQMFILYEYHQIRWRSKDHLVLPSSNFETISKLYHRCTHYHHCTHYQ